MTDNTIQTKTLPLLALRGLHVFPEMLLTFDVERVARFIEKPVDTAAEEEVEENEESDPSEQEETE